MHATRTFGIFRISAPAIARASAIVCAVLALAGCGKPERVRLAVSNWVGYTPLLFLQERGLLGDRVEISNTESLGESLNLFEAGFTDGFCGTQAEAMYANLVGEDAVPVVLVDRSRGADVVLSNRASVRDIAAGGLVEVFLEMGSINQTLFREFVALHGLESLDYHPNNLSQPSIALMQPAKNETQLIVTYEPYATMLEHAGFHQLASTAQVDLLVLDALYVRPAVAERHAATLKELAGQIAAALDVLRENPREFYRTVKPYLGGQSYEEFAATLREVEWLTGPVSPEFTAILHANGVKTEWLVR